MTGENEFSIEKFSPAKAEVLKVVELAKAVDVKDLEAVHDTRIGLRDLRITITKRGKELRDGALKFQKEVIAREKELTGTIEPEEQRLSQVEDEAKLRREMELRREELPTRKAALETVQDSIQVSDDELLAMADTEFNEYRLRRIDAKLARDKEEFEFKKQEEAKAAAEKKAKEDAEARAKADKEQAERDAANKAETDRLANERAKLDAEKAAIEATKRANEEAEAKRLRDIELKEREEKLAKEKAEREAKEAADKKAADELAEKTKQEDLQRQEKYMKFLADNTFNNATDLIVPSVDKKSITMYRFVAKFEI